MNILQKISRGVIEKSFRFSVWFIERFHNKNPYREKVNALRKLPEGTLGRDIAQCLDDNKLGLVPNYESHDLKHVLLDFKMTPVDEIRMQAFMLGNGNYTIPCFAIFTFGAVLLPEQWSVFYTDFKRGQSTEPVSEWTIEEYAEKETQQLRNTIFEKQIPIQPVFTMKKITKYGAIASIIAGISGMLFCLPFLFSSSVADLVGAGFPFVGGAILAAGGLLALSNLSRPVTVPA